jgi:hypothetical protein
MKYKVSIILKTNRENKNTSYSDWKNFKDWDNPIIDPEFKQLVNSCFPNTQSFIEPTVKSLIQSNMDKDDYELIIVHRNPEKIKKYLEPYVDDINIKLVQEKHSYWHDLNGKYPTLCNAVNTGVIWSDGEMIVSTDDCTLFPKDLLSVLSKRLTQPVGITYSFTNKTNQVIPDDWKDIRINDKIVKETYKESMMGKHIAYGYCFNIPLEHMLRLNGFNENMDGAMFQDEGEFAERYYMRYHVDRYPIDTKIYMFGHNYDNVNSNPYALRNNHVWKDMIPRFYRANISRPTKQLCDKYKEWHIKRYGSIDKNFDVCREITTFDLEYVRLHREWHTTISTGERIL